MPAAVRLTKKELLDLIESTEAAGCDTACLRGLLGEVEEEEKLRKPERLGIPPKARPEEMTIEDYLAEKRAQTEIKHGTDLECIICHDKFDHLLSGTCENCWREWMLSAKLRS